ncbi:DUF2642 domain-containing protein [Jeotgalibacillus sp. S-D1]|uniref:YuzF family protein n=1 Tax=Jeotgalibacillus sp. S-D1 TaxID=2552189 RepID=UPI00105A33F3|nr:YuzF family protein [Jeotgalibacillus sp. S-D1]TDL32008.1 DUF2642 domain-containing protein [Jeotgalibacillus sp. S-D1]
MVTPNSNYSQSGSFQYRTFIDPFVVSRLQSVLGANMIVETTRDSIRGELMEVQPDHIALKAGDSTIFVRIQQIVSVMPI